MRYLKSFSFPISAGFQLSLQVFTDILKHSHFTKRLKLWQIWLRATNSSWGDRHLKVKSNFAVILWIWSHIFANELSLPCLLPSVMIVAYAYSLAKWNPPCLAQNDRERTQEHFLGAGKHLVYSTGISQVKGKGKEKRKGNERKIHTDISWSLWTILLQQI